MTAMTRGCGDKADIDFDCMQIETLQNIAYYSAFNVDPKFTWSDTCVGYSAHQCKCAAFHIAGTGDN